jgi:hypothetical protein
VLVSADDRAVDQLQRLWQLAAKVSNMRSQMPSRLVVSLASHWREADPKTLDH